jgi:hypothetical protein
MRVVADSNHVELSPTSLTTSPPVIGAPALTVTVGEIAEQLAPLWPERQATIERSRSWTRDGILEPLKNKHAGTGRHRVYDARTSAVKVAVLSALADAGLQIASHSYLPDALDEASRAYENWLGDEKRPVVFLQISRQGGGTARCSISKQPVEPAREARVSILVNLSPIFSTLEAQLRKDPTPSLKKEATLDTKVNRS